MGQHASVIGGSNCKQRIFCPGSYQLEAGVERKDSSVFARKGSALHELAETIIIDNEQESHLLTHPFVTIIDGEEVTTDVDTITEKIIPILAYLDSLFDKHDDLEYEVESKVAFGDSVPEQFGTVDFIARSKKDKVTYVTDWKFGDGVGVSAEDNYQLLYYATAASLDPETADLFEGSSKIVLSIVQPYRGHSDDVVSTWDTSPARLVTFHDLLIRSYAKCISPDPTLIRGDWCRWCRAKPGCLEWVDKVDKVLASAEKRTDGFFEEFTPKALELSLADAAELETWIKDLRAYCHERMESGDKIPGWKLVAKRATRRWTSDVVAEKLMRSLKFKVREIFPKKIISVAQAEKILPKGRKNVLDDAVIKSSTGTTLAPESDKRPAVVAGDALERLAKAIG